MPTPYLLQPIKIRENIVRNRVMMAPMETRLNAPDGSITEDMIAYYAERAKGGAGTIVVENTFVDGESSRSGLISSGLHNEHMIAGKGLLADSIKSFGACAIIQLSHGGEQSHPFATGFDLVGPSVIEGRSHTKPFRALLIPEIEAIENSFAQAARRACAAGFDGVEIHAAHGYLISSFLSPFKNQRTDSYGGNPKNRARILTNIINKIRLLVSPKFIIGVRMNVIDGVPGGVTLEDSIETVRILNSKADYISVSAGIGAVVGTLMIPPMYVKGPTIIELVGKLKKNAIIPVFGVGALNQETGEAALARGLADGIVLGRALIADPELVNKLEQNRPEDIRPCCRGNEGCFSRMVDGLTIRCEVNPECGLERNRKLRKTSHKKKVVVIGGGVAGMEAARIAACIGHEVILFERSSRLGGHLTEASEPIFKSRTGELLKWLIRQVELSSVEIHLQSEATPDDVLALHADAVIVSVGSQYYLPNLEGVGFGICPAEALRTCGSNLNTNAVVIGGGMVGAETALHLAMQGCHSVTIIEMEKEIAREHDVVTRSVLRGKLLEHGVRLLTECTVKKISDNNVIYSDCKGKEHVVESNHTILATGLIPDVKQRIAFAALPNVYFAGDCVRGGKIFTAMHNAWEAIMRIEDERI